MSGPEEAAELLAQVQGGWDTGCLIIESTSQGVCRVYILIGEVVHAVGPTGEGEAALAAALAWPDVTISFDETAEIPTKITITDRPRPLAAEKKGAAATGAATFQTLSGNRRVLDAQWTYFAGGCLFVLAILVGLVAAFASGADAVLAIAVASVIGTGLLFLGLYIRYRVVFRSETVEVQDGLDMREIPLVVDAPIGVITGEPEVVVSLPTRCLIGSMGRCRIEIYSGGLQIWKGPENPEPRWQFRYEDLLQAESVTITNLGMYARDQYFLRLIAARPRMVFVIGSTWLANPDVSVLLSKLREHRVATFTES